MWKSEGNVWVPKIKFRSVGVTRSTIYMLGSLVNLSSVDLKAKLLKLFFSFQHFFKMFFKINSRMVMFYKMFGSSAFYSII